MFKEKKMNAVSPEGGYCFFGYYDKCTWDEKEEFFLFHEAGFQNRAPAKNDSVKICLMEIKTGKVDIIDETCAWNFQQGSMLQWLPGQRILYNSVRDGTFISIIYEMRSGKKREIPRPVSSVSPDGKYALSINFARLARWRPGYGYEGLPDTFENKRWPEDDGVYLVNLETGNYKLIIPLTQLLDFRKEKGVSESFGWINHTEFSPDGKRFSFLNRWKKETSGQFRTRFFSSDKEGKEVYDLVDSYIISHYDWKNNEVIIAWIDYKDKQGFWLIDDKTGKYRFLSDNIQTLDGHCSYSDDERYVLLDTYPVDGYRYLKIFDTHSNTEKTIGRYYSLPEASGEIRCDLHPRWGRTQKKISLDSTHEGYRRVYVEDIEKYL
jgi:hypothetical protein